MRLASYEIDGRTRWGAVVDDGIADLSDRFADAATLDAALARGRLDDVRALGAPRPDHALDAVRLLPPIGRPAKIVCVGLNYPLHREESGEPEQAHPTLFTRFWDSHVGDGTPVVRPAQTRELDFEGELAVVIGREAFRVDEATAPGHVAGYSVYNDLTARDWQDHTSQWTPGKNFHGVGAFGPWLVTVDDVPEVERQLLTTRVDGTIVQQARIAEMIFPIGRLISYISQFTPLRPGDVIATGTPGGVGMAQDPPRYLQPGAVVEVSISGVGTLTNAIVDGPADHSSPA